MARKTVLLVDDDRDNRTIYTVLLEHVGYTVLQATNGADGVRLARENLPDIILMDLSMPVLDGWGAIRQLREDQRTAQIPVCALSAHVLLEGDYDRARAAGFDCYLTKPIEPRQVVQAVRDRIGPPTDNRSGQ